MLDFHPMQEHQAPPERLVELLQLARRTLDEQGMADMDEYGDMLKWTLPTGGEGCFRNIHVFHPDWCSWDDRFWGTIHYHAGTIRGTVLMGHMRHYTYEATPDPEGDRFHKGEPYRLTRHVNEQGAGTSYELPAMVPHWLEPTALTLTYFEEDIGTEMSDLVNPASKETDEHLWTQEQAEALLPELLRRIDDRIAALTATASA